MTCEWSSWREDHKDRTCLVVLEVAKKLNWRLSTKHFLCRVPDLVLAQLSGN